MFASANRMETLSGSSSRARVSSRKAPGRSPFRNSPLAHQQVHLAKAGFLADEIARRFCGIRRLKRQHAVLQREIVWMRGEDTVNRRLQLPEVAQRQHGQEEKIRFHRARRRLLLELGDKHQALLALRAVTLQRHAAGEERIRLHVERGKVRIVDKRDLRSQLLCGVACAGIGYAQLDLTRDEHQVVLERFSDKDNVVGISKQARVGGGRFLQTQIAAPRREPIGFGQARGEHFGRNARRDDRRWTCGAADADGQRKDEEISATHRSLRHRRQGFRSFCYLVTPMIPMPNEGEAAVCTISPLGLNSTFANVRGGTPASAPFAGAGQGVP